MTNGFINKLYHVFVIKLKLIEYLFYNIYKNK